MRSLDLQTSRRFGKKYNQTNHVLKCQAEGAIHDFVSSFRSNPITLLKGYQRLQGSADPRVLEIKIGGGNRLVAHFSKDRLVLLDLGDHEVVPRYLNRSLDTDLSTASEAPDAFWPEYRSSLYHSQKESISFSHYASELSAEWMFFLDRHQIEVADRIFDRIVDFDSTAHFVLGGPGTGKTCVLLKLLHALVDDCEVGFECSNALAEHLEASGMLNLESCRRDAKENVDILIVDDPTVGQVETALKRRKRKSAGHVVVGFDPLQLNENIDDDKLARWKKEFGVNIHELKECYRQKRAIGETVIDIFESISESSPYLALSKKQGFKSSRTEITRLANEIDFVVPGGYATVYENSSLLDVAKELKRIKKFPAQMWRHVPGLLVITDGSLSDRAQYLFDDLRDSAYLREVHLSSVESIKGLDFQHAFLFVKRNLYDELVHGFQGSGSTAYTYRQRLRIPFSRAKDSLVTFVIDDENLLLS